MAEIDSFPLEVKIKGIGVRTFETISELRTQFHNEHDFWKRLSEDTQQKTSAFQGTDKAIIEEFILKLKEIEDLATRIENGNKGSIPKSLKRQIELAFDLGYSYKSFVGIGLKDLSVNYGWHTTHAAMQFLFRSRKNLPQHLDDQKIGYLMGMLLERQIPNKHNFSGIESLQKESEELLNALKKLKTEKENSLNELSEKYKAIKDIQEPATYWSTKQKEHKTASKRYAFATVIVVAGLGFGIIYWRMATLEKPATTNTANQTESDKIEQQKDQWFDRIAELFPFTLSAIGLFWLTRILVRMLLTQIHLGTDAAERVVIIQTYQAMLEGNNLKPDERKIVLEQVFRHIQDGIVKDDAAPSIQLLNK